MVAVPLAVHDPLVSRRLLVRVWMTALCGVAKTFLWPNAPRYLSALTYVSMGWSCLPYLPILTAAVDTHVVVLVSGVFGQQLARNGYHGMSIRPADLGRSICCRDQHVDGVSACRNV